MAYDHELTPRQNIAPELQALAEELSLKLANTQPEHVISLLNSYLAKVLDIGFCGVGCIGWGCTFCDRDE